MKKYLRIACFFVLIIMVGILSGCGKEPGVDPNVDPGKIFTHYNELTRYYGTAGRMETLNALGMDLQLVNIQNPDRLGLPLTETYAGVQFDVYICFSGKDTHFSSVEYIAEYRFPEEKDKLIADILAVSDQLIKDFGDATDTSYVFNWAEVMLKEEWNRDIAFWQDPAVLDRLIDEEFCGELLWWNLTPVASETILKELESYGDKDAVHGLLFDLMANEIDGIVTISLWY
jgi:hypothetical protein